MSHVLVDDRFESISDFYYPTTTDYFVQDRNSKKWNAKEAMVWLANIEFVRMQGAIKEKHQLKNQDSFSQVVKKINASFKDVELTLLVHNRTVVVNNKLRIEDLSRAEFAMFYWFADNRKQGKDGVTAPTEHIGANKKGKNAVQEHIKALTGEFELYYECVRSDKSVKEKRFSVDKKFFESTKSRLQTKLAANLGWELSAKLAIKQQVQRQPFYLDLDKNCIEIICER